MNDKERKLLEYELIERLGHPHFIIHTHEIENNKLIVTDLCKLKIVDCGKYPFRTSQTPSLLEEVE